MTEKDQIKSFESLIEQYKTKIAIYTKMIRGWEEDIEKLSLPKLDYYKFCLEKDSKGIVLVYRVRNYIYSILKIYEDGTFHRFSNVGDGFVLENDYQQKIKCVSSSPNIAKNTGKDLDLDKFKLITTSCAISICYDGYTFFRVVNGILYTVGLICDSRIKTNSGGELIERT